MAVAGYNTATPPVQDRAGNTASDEKTVLRMAMDLFYKARDHRKPLLQQWQQNYNYLHNSFAGTGVPARRTISSPEIKPIISGLVAWATDTEPIFDCEPEASPFTPFYDTFADMADDLEMCLQSGWRHGEIDAEVEKLLWDGFTYGIGFLKTTWDASLHSGLGDYAVRRVDPFTFFVDPYARSMGDASYFVEVHTMSRQEMEKRWPGSNKKVDYGATSREDGSESPTRLAPGANPSAPLANPAAIPPNTDSRYGLPGQGRDGPATDPGVTIFEFWLKTQSTIPAPNPGPDAMPTHSDDERCIDVWRCIVIANGVCILMDEPASEFWSTEIHPYDRYTPEDTGEFYGDSLVQQLIPLQQIVNRNLASILANLSLVGNPVFLESNRNDFPRSKIPNLPGQRIPVDGDVNNTARWLEPPKLPPDYMNLVNWATQRMEVVSGLSAITRGAMPSGRNAQGVMDSVAEAGFVRLRMNLRNLQRCLTSAGNKAGAYICEFYDVPRVVALVGPDGEKAARALQGQNFYVPTTEGRVPLKFAINVDIGSQQATSKSARFSELMSLYTVGGIDVEALLEGLQFPGHKALATRMREFQASQGMLGQPATARQQAGRPQ